MSWDFRRWQPVQDQLFQRKWDTCVLNDQQNEPDSSQMHEERSFAELMCAQNFHNNDSNTMNTLSA